MRQLDPGPHHADPARRNEEPVGLAPGHHLGIAGDDAYTGLPGGGGHGLHDPAQDVHRQPLLDDEAGGEVAGLRTHHREVVHRPVDRELSDVAARKDQRAHHIGVGGKREAVSCDGEHRGLLLGGEQRIGKRRREETVDQVVGRLAAAPVTQGDLGIAEHRPGAARLPGALDALHLCFERALDAGAHAGTPTTGSGFCFCRWYRP